MSYSLICQHSSRLLSGPPNKVVGLTFGKLPVSFGMPCCVFRLTSIWGPIQNPRSQIHHYVDLPPNVIIRDSVQTKILQRLVKLCGKIETHDTLQSIQEIPMATRLSGAFDFDTPVNVHFYYRLTCGGLFTKSKNPHAVRFSFDEPFPAFFTAYKPLKCHGVYANLSSSTSMST
jgi:hypothetical protein